MLRPAASDADAACSDLAALLEVSDLLDAELRLRLAAYREGWRAAEQAHAGDYSRGYADGLTRRKHAEHEAVEALRLYLRRWELRGQGRTRRTFGDPHPDDCGPGEAAQRARASWERLGRRPSLGGAAA